MKAKKKAFTLVELVVVIAVVAILAAVLIPTFASIIKQANENADTQLVRHLNTALAMDGKEHKTMQSALDAAEGSGFDVAKINAKVDTNEILWDSKNDVFCYLKDGAIEYVPNSVSAANALDAGDYRLWKISDTVDRTYSTYYTGTATDIETSKGFDAGKVTGIPSITYTNPDSAQNVVIRTNSYDTVVTVSAPEDIVSHYGEANKIDVTAVAPSSYHEYGDVLGNIELKSGRVVAESGAKASAIVIKATVDQINNTSAPVVISADNTAAPEIPIILPSTVKEAIDTKAETDSHYGITTSDEKSLAYPDLGGAYILGKGSYDTLYDALYGAEDNDTIILLRDCTLESDLPGFGGITLDLGGNTISYSGLYYPLELYFETIIKNGTIVVTGSESSKSSGCIYAHEGSNIQLINLTLEQRCEDNGLYTIFNDGADLTVRYCTLKANNGMAIYARGGNLSVDNTTFISSAKGVAGIKYEEGSGNIVVGEKVVIDNFITGIEINKTGFSPTYAIDKSVKYEDCDEDLQIVENSN